MGGSLGPVLANIIMAECNKFIVNKLAKEKAIMFYTRYVDHTLLIITKKDINYVLNQFNNFDKNLKFTIGTFENSVPQFFDIEICQNGVGIYYKRTQTSQYVQIISYTLWRWKSCWIRSFIFRAKKICSAYFLTAKFNALKDTLLGMVTHKMLKMLKMLKIINHALRNNGNSNNTFSHNDIQAVRIYIKIKHSGETADSLIKQCTKKLYKNFKN